MRLNNAMKALPWKLRNDTYVAHNCHGKTKSHGTTNFTHGKTKLTHGKTKKTSWSAVGQRLVSGCYLHLKWYVV